MDHKENIIAATIGLIEEKGERVEEITVREICKRAGVGLGLINYYFGSKECLMEECVERIVNGIVKKFGEIRDGTQHISLLEKLEELGYMTLTFLFDHAAVSRISALSDARTPKADDNTQRTINAYLPLVAACRPDWDEKKIARKTFTLISAMQAAFMRCEVIRVSQGTDLKDPIQRRKFHAALLREIMEVEK